MAAGDDITLTEETYQRMIGSQATTIEILVRRVAAKDEAIRNLEARVFTLTEELGKKEKGK